MGSGGGGRGSAEIAAMLALTLSPMISEKTAAMAPLIKGAVEPNVRNKNPPQVGPMVRPSVPAD